MRAGKGASASGASSWAPPAPPCAAFQPTAARTHPQEYNEILPHPFPSANSPVAYKLADLAEQVISSGSGGDTALLIDVMCLAKEAGVCMMDGVLEATIFAVCAAAGAATAVLLPRAEGEARAHGGDDRCALVTSLKQALSCLLGQMRKHAISFAVFVVKNESECDASWGAWRASRPSWAALAAANVPASLNSSPNARSPSLPTLLQAPWASCATAATWWLSCAAC